MTKATKALGCHLPWQDQPSRSPCWGFSRGHRGEGAGRPHRLPAALVLACLMEESGFQNCKCGFFQNRLIHSGKQTPLRPPPFLQLQRTCHLGTQRQPFTREIKKDLGWLCQAQLPLKPKERLQEHGCLSVPFRELTYVPTAQVQAKAESGLMAHKAGVS